MKQIYSFATFSLILLFLSRGAVAQTYTAVRSGNWHVASGPNIWDPSGEPSDTCKNCTITIKPGVSVNLNTSVVLTKSSTLIIGSASSTSSAVLTVDGSSGTDWSSSNNVIVLNDGSSPQNRIVLASTSALINATGASSEFDGIFTTFPNTPVTYFRQVGKGYASFSGTTVANHAIVNIPTLSGVQTLSADGTLPVILSEFSAILDNNEVDLSWTTDLEINSDHFAIERSVDAGAHWSVLGTVAARGNSSVAVNYSYTDASPATGINQYRLQSVDRDGKFAYSGIKTIRNGLIGSVSIFPNPAKDYVNITLGANANAATGSLSIRLISQSGQLLAEKKVNNAGGTTVSLPVSSYPQGNYLIQVTAPDGAQQISKVFISRQ